jgi:capsular polysaccharide export protein
LGAELVPPLSLVSDASGIYYDPTKISDLERLLSRPCKAWERTRADRLTRQVVRGGLTKYNPRSGDTPDLPPGHRILVPGQVEDDASIRFGAGAERTNLALLERTRRENPTAIVVYKPHPDVVAGLRSGTVPDDVVRRLADFVATDADPAGLIDACDEVWTITSTLGFEALLRGKPVTCLGMPFYAGWGLTRDLLEKPSRRSARPTLSEFVNAAIIAYPRYVDPVSGLPCPPEVVAERLSRNEVPTPGRANRLLSKLQGIAASQSWLWRR